MPSPRTIMLAWWKSRIAEWFGKGRSDHPTDVCIQLLSSMTRSALGWWCLVNRILLSIIRLPYHLKTDGSSPQMNVRTQVFVNGCLVQNVTNVVTVSHYPCSSYEMDVDSGKNAHQRWKFWIQIDRNDLYFTSSMLEWHPSASLLHNDAYKWTWWLAFL